MLLLLPQWVQSPQIIQVQPPRRHPAAATQTNQDYNTSEGERADQGSNQATRHLLKPNLMMLRFACEVMLLLWVAHSGSQNLSVTAGPAEPQSCTMAACG